MRADNPWPRALTQVALIIGGAAFIGLLAGDVLLWVALASAGYLAWNLQNLVRLERWLRRGGVTDPPQARGIWGEIFDGLHRYRRRHRLRRQHLASLLLRFRQSANAVPDATVVLADHGEMQWWNAAARRLLGLRWPQDEGQRIDNLLRHPDFRRFLENDSGRDSLTLPSPVDRAVTLEIRIIPYGESQRLLLARDITRLHRLERMRRDFVANVSHELRTPLTVIHGLAETLTDGDEPLDPMTARALSLIGEQTERMRRLVDDLLLLARLETDERMGEARRVDVAGLLRQVAEEATAVASRNSQRVEVQLDRQLAIRGNESELRSAFSNLVFNAVKYTPAGGRIELRWYRDEAGAHFSVRDTGVGIPAHHIPRLTERFYRVDSGRHASTGGTGLGLAIVKHVLDRHDAYLEISSRPGAGSLFVCHFPPAAVVEQDARSA